VSFTSSRIVATLATSLVLVVACHHDRDRDEKQEEASEATFAPRDSLRKLGPGDVRIATVDSTLELALVGDSIVTGFGSKVMDKVREKTDTSGITGDGLSATIQRAVKGGVAKAMDHEIHYPITDISDVRFEDGGLRFYGTDGRKMSVFENSHINGRKVSESFSPEDAQRFISAFHARKASHG
jgi:hypothetical protein